MGSDGVRVTFESQRLDVGLDLGKTKISPTNDNLLLVYFLIRRIYLQSKSISELSLIHFQGQINIENISLQTPLVGR